MDNHSDSSTSSSERALRQFRESGGIRAAPVEAIRRFPFDEAFQGALSGWQDRRANGLARFAHQEYIDRGFVPRSAHTAFIPRGALTALAGQRAIQPYQTTVSGSGASLVETSMRGDPFIDALRPRSVVLSLGAETVSGLRGDIQIPRQVTASSAYWLTTGGSPVQSGAITESEATFDSSALTTQPAQIAGIGTVTRELVEQAGNLFNSVHANDSLNLLASGVDIAAIQGTGAGGQPTGITNTSGVGTASGASFAYATSVAAAATVANANAVINRRALGWATTPTVASVLAQRAKIAGYPEYVWDGNVDSGSINGHRALSSNNLPTGAAIFGDFSQVLILSWGEDSPIELEVNHYSANFAGGDIQYRVIMSCNIVIRHPQSFVVVSGIT